MSPILYAFPVFLGTMALEAWLLRRRGRPGYDVPDALTSLHAGVLSQVAGVFTKLLTFAIYVLVYQAYAIGSWPTGTAGLGPLVWVTALVAYDFGYYWAHRLGHEVGIMWAAHNVHHSSEHFNLSTALRQSSTGGLFGWVVFLPLAVLGVPPMMLAIVGLTNLLYQYWVHTELIGRLGWLEYVLVTPSNHRVHHGQNDYCIDRNYGGMFIVWDRLFGTYADERADEPVVYGVRKALRSYDPVWANLHHYADLAREAAATPGWRGKLQVWLAPPGGWRDEKVQPFEAAKFVRFAPPAPADVKRYAIVHYLALVLMLAHFLMVQDSLELAERLAYAGVIFGSAVAIGGLLEGKPWAFRVEAGRVAALIAAIIAWPVWFTLATPTPARVVMVAGLAYCLVWAVRSLRAGPVVAPAE
ncbi:MAG: sterol desaturase family protein [Polymorphobacter sp.]